MEGYMEQALEQNVRMLKTFIQNQLAQVFAANTCHACTSAMRGESAREAEL